MLVNQISVFIENKPGRLYQLANVLAESKIDLLTLSIADTRDYGILRTITCDNERALVVLKEAGFTVSNTPLVGVEVADQPGGLAGVLAVLQKEHMNMEYLYSYARTSDKSAIILLKVEDPEKAIATLNANGIKTIDRVY